MQAVLSRQPVITLIFAILQRAGLRRRTPYRTPSSRRASRAMRRDRLLRYAPIRRSLPLI